MIEKCIIVRGATYISAMAPTLTRASWGSLIAIISYGMLPAASANNRGGRGGI